MDAKMHRDYPIDNCAKAMGENLGNCFRFLRSEYGELHREYSYYKQLYHQGAEVEQLLNSSAPDFFNLVKTLLHDSLVLRIGRLCDPTDSRRNSNLSLDRLAQNAGTDKSELEVLVGEVKAAAVPFIKWRNKVVAHTDLTVATQGLPDSIPMLDAEKVLSKIEACLKVVGARYGFADLPISDLGMDAGSLIKYLRAAGPEIERQMQN